MSNGYGLLHRQPHLFWKHVDASGDCWDWTGSLNSYGYGMVTRFDGPRKYQLMAHRGAYELLVNPIPKGLTLDHLCRNKRCVNPDHLEPVTDRVNILRSHGPSAQSARATHCPRGHEYTGRRNSRGYRVCVECVRLKNAAYTAAERERLGRNVHNRHRTHCLRGHDLNGPDVYIDRRGRRQCRACERARHHAKKAA